MPVNAACPGYPDCARAAGCEWLHIDFDGELRSSYFDACDFEPAPAGASGCEEVAQGSARLRQAQGSLVRDPRARPLASLPSEGHYFICVIILWRSCAASIRVIAARCLLPFRHWLEPL